MSLDWTEVLLVLVPAMAVLLTSALPVMVPLFLLLRIRGVTSIWTTVGIGAIAGVAGRLLFRWLHYGPESACLLWVVENDFQVTWADLVYILDEVTFGGVLSGLIHGLIFWQVWRRTRTTG